MRDQLILKVANDLRQLSYVREQVDAFGERNKLSSEAVFGIKLALSELLANTISYGYPDEGAHTIEVRLNLHGSSVKLEIIDDALAFDPRSARAPETKTTVNDLPTGGLGIHLVKNFADEIEYKRKRGRNYVFITKNLEDS